MTDLCCGLSVIFCSFISHLIGRETINIPEILFSVHGFMGKTVNVEYTALTLSFLFLIFTNSLRKAWIEVLMHPELPKNVEEKVRERLKNAINGTMICSPENSGLNV